MKKSNTPIKTGKEREVLIWRPVIEQQMEVLRLLGRIILKRTLHKFISVINQLDAQNFCFTISLFHGSTCFEHMCSKHVEP